MCGTCGCGEHHHHDHLHDHEYVHGHEHHHHHHDEGKVITLEQDILQRNNLEVPGSSPGWSTNKRLILNRIEPLLIFGLRHTSPVFV